MSSWLFRASNIEGELHHLHTPPSHLTCYSTKYMSTKRTTIPIRFLCIFLANTQRLWILRRLLPELEYLVQLRICIHDRDWFGVIQIIENIVNTCSTKTTKKIVSIIFNKLACSPRCQSEMSIAHHRFMEDQRDSFVTVLLEKIKMKNMTPLRKHLLSSKTYMKWPDSVIEKKYFWREEWIGQHGSSKNIVWDIETWQENKFYLENKEDTFRPTCIKI